MPALIASAIAFFASMAGIVTALGIILAVVIAALADPAGWLNQSICFVITMIAAVFPATPSNLRLESILVSLTPYLSDIGVYAVREAFHAFRDVLTFIMIFKVYKMIPFKAT
jgi:hypothetical protein